MEPFIDEENSDDEEMLDEEQVMPILPELNAGRLGLGDDEDDEPQLEEDDDDDGEGEGGEAEEDQSEEIYDDQTDDDDDGEEQQNVFLNVGQAVAMGDMVEVFEDQVDLDDDYEEDLNEENLRSSMISLVGALRRDPITHSYLPLQQSAQPRRSLLNLSPGEYFAFSTPNREDLYPRLGGALTGAIRGEGRDVVPQELEQMLLELLADSDTSRTPSRTTPTPSRGSTRPFDNIFGNSLFGNLSGLGVTPIRGGSSLSNPTNNNNSQMDTSGDVTTPVQTNNTTSVEAQTELLTPTTPIQLTPIPPIVESSNVASSSPSSDVVDAVPSEPQASASTETVATPVTTTPTTTVEPTTPVVTEAATSSSATTEVIVEPVEPVEPVATQPQQPRQQNFPIDPAFFTEMPDFIRQELLEMHYDQLIDTTSSNEETAISQDFLDALPNEIRNEVLRFEREQRPRRPPPVTRPTTTVPTTTTNTTTEAVTTNPTTPPPPPPPTTSNTDTVNPVEFLSTLSPELRRTVLLEADDDLISMLTPDLAREAAELRLRAHQRIRAQQQYIDRRQEGTMRENAFAKAVKKQIIENEKEEEKETIFKEKELVLLLRLYMLTRSFSSTQQPFFSKICLAHKETRKILVDILIEIVLNYNTPLDQIPERMKILCDIPQREGVFVKEENMIPPVVINCTLYLLASLCKSEVGPYILPIITGIEFTETSEGVRGEKFVKLLSLLQPKMFSSNFFLGFIQLVDSCAKFISESVKVLNEENNKLKKSMTTLEEQINKLPGKASAEQSETNEEGSSSTTEQSEYTEKTKQLEETTEKYKASQTKYETLISYVTGLYNEAVIRNVISLIPDVDVQEKALKLVSSILDNIACSLPIRKVILIELSTKCREEAKKVKESLSKVTLFKSNSLLPFDNEKLAFCRIVKIYSSILKRYKKEREAVEGPFIDHSLLSEHSLDYVWEALDSFLSSVPIERDETDEKTRALSSLKKKRNNNSYNELFPFIEAFFAFQSGFSEEKEEKNSTLLSSMEEHTPTSAKGFGDKAIIENFLEKHREILNAQIEANPSLLTSTLSLMMKYPKYVDFKNKLVWFKAKLKEESKKTGGVAPMSVRRSQIFTDSYFYINGLLPEECKGKLQIKFEGEEGYDAGGVKREWFSTLSREMLYPGYALFAPCADRTTYHPNPSSYVNQEHLSYFRFTGRIIAMAIYNEQPLDCHFTRSFYKHILGIPITYHDIESIDPSYYKNLKWMLTNSIGDVLFHTFTHEFDEFGKTKEIELKPNGKNIPVTDENKAEYVRLVTELKMTKSIEKQLEQFLKAFYDIIPRKLIQIFNEQELELLISGLPDIDIQDLKNNTIYGHGYTKDSVHIKWFWNVVESFGKDDKALLLQFVTGTSKVPLGGFSQLIGANGENQLFCIQKANVGSQRLPTAHTCFNQLDLPEYDTEDVLRERLLVALRFGSEGFGFV